MVARIAPGILDTGARARAVRLGLATLLAGVALAGPRWGVERAVVRSSGIDVVLALDASLSMLAQDERPSRLERVKQEVRRLRALAPGDRTALVAFAGRSYILTPLTTDEGALALFLDALDPSVVGQAGSSLARAIRQGTDLLQATRSESDRAIVVMSDGEAFEPIADVEEAARQAAAAGISVVTVGFGSADGATIPVREGNAVSEKRDAEGAVVITRYLEAPLAAAAQAAGGTFIPANATDKAARVRAALAGLRATRRASDAGRDLTPRYQLFLAPALLLLLLDTVLARRGAATGARRGGAEHARMAAAPPASAARPGSQALVLVLLAPIASEALGGCGALPSAARTDDALVAYERGDHAVAVELYRRRLRGGGSLVARYNVGTALVAADSLDAARAPLDEARRAPDAELRWRAHFNLGLAHLARGLRLAGGQRPGGAGRRVAALPSSAARPSRRPGRQVELRARAAATQGAEWRRWRGRRWRRGGRHSPAECPPRAAAASGGRAGAAAGRGDPQRGGARRARRAGTQAAAGAAAPATGGQGLVNVDAPVARGGRSAARARRWVVPTRAIAHREDMTRDIGSAIEAAVAPARRTGGGAGQRAPVWRARGGR
jgi:Ca-activated chloride channel family protein